MQITGNPYPLDRAGVDSAPDEPGVYALYIRDEIVYYGTAEHSLRETLRDHHDDERERLNPREAATGFTFECPSDPDKRRRQLVFQFVATRGQLPRRNAREVNGRSRTA